MKVDCTVHVNGSAYCEVDVPCYVSFRILTDYDNQQVMTNLVDGKTRVWIKHLNRQCFHLAKQLAKATAKAKKAAAKST